MDVAAHSIANANTPGFKPAEVDSVELAGGGVAPVVSQPGPAEPAVAGPAASSPPPSGTDLARETIRLVMALLTATAAARAMQAAASTDRSLLDTRA
jgi:hypothetical protein